MVPSLASGRMLRLSLGSCRLCSFMYVQIAFTACKHELTQMRQHLELAQGTLSSCICRLEDASQESPPIEELTFAALPILSHFSDPQLQRGQPASS